MPIRSKQQNRFLHKQMPDLAEKWKKEQEKKTGSRKLGKVPKKVRKKKTSKQPRRGRKR